MTFRRGVGYSCSTMSTSPGGWSELLAREHRAAVSVFAGGILVFAINTFLTAASLPSTIADIGGDEFYPGSSRSS
ncbi:hypothetical protein MTX80_19590 [Gordonia amicalis]|nr:hypothetical protein [Gordonia amicalis]UOG21164.1 hypothetical protein MTX80_19590 [Gordonia amicalis]